MRTRLFIISLVATVALGSCTSGWMIEKRHYRNGFYISNSKVENRSRSAENVNPELNSVVPLAPVDNEQEACAEECDMPINDSAISAATHEPILIPEHSLPRQTSEFEVDSLADQQLEQQVLPAPLSEDPRVVKWLFWGALVLLLAVLIMAPGFFYPWYFLVTVPGFVPILMWFAALLMSIFAARIALKRSRNSANEEYANYYRKWFRASRILAWIIGGIMIISVIILALAILALSGLGG